MSTLIEQSRIPPAETIPYGLCHCGCGQKTGVEVRDKGVNRRKGTPYKFVHGHHSRVSLEDRFWKYVVKEGPIVNVKLGMCWSWRASTSGDGYGSLTVRISYKLFHIGAHRVSYEIHFGEIPEGKLVLHKCDNPPCTNPAHLYAGTYEDNIRDAYDRLRQPIGEAHPSSKVTEEIVREIRANYAHPVIDGYVRSYTLIGKKYGLSSTNVKAILLGWTWKHLL